MLIIQKYLEVYVNITNDPNDNITYSEFVKFRAKKIGRTPYNGNAEDVNKCIETLIQTYIHT